MSRHASASLLTFAIGQIWAVVALSRMPGGHFLPFLALALLLIVALPFSRRLDARWQDLGRTALPSSGLIARFRRDRSRLWALAVALPTLWAGCFVVIAQAATSGL